MEVQTIKENLNNVLVETDFKNLGEKKVGKVRDSYFAKDHVVLITTDRQSAFDRVLAAVPFKGQVLNQTSAWWFEKTKNIVPNHVIAIPDPNVTVGKLCEILPVEMVVRTALTGTTSTSIWVNYEKGQREFGGLKLPDGLKKNSMLGRPILTPTTKFEEHDRNLTAAEIVSEGLMSQADWDKVSKMALGLFAFGQSESLKRGLILESTKYEFGRLPNGEIIIADEIHTPDSSRYWLANSYEQRIAEGKEPENIDKEFLRLWFKENCDPYKDEVLPEAPPALVAELSRRYIMLYEMITGEKFKATPGEDIAKRIENNLQSYRV
jgi:phosphoribosylaminoimidazole-succinocarboxamide synthase